MPGPAWLLQRNVIWGFENGYHSSRKGQSERATWPPETLIGHPPLSSKAGVDPQTALANQSAPRCHLGLWFAIDPSAPKPAKPDQLLSIRSDYGCSQRAGNIIIFIHSSVLSAPSMFAGASSHFCCSFLYSNILSVDIDSHLLLCYRVRYQSHIRLNMDSPLPFIAYLVSSDSRCIVSISHLIPPSLCRMIDPLSSVCISYFHILCIAPLVYTFVVLYLVPQSTSHIQFHAVCVTCIISHR